jgi:hypothetical protein
MESEKILDLTTNKPTCGEERCITYYIEKQFQSLLTGIEEEKLSKALIKIKEAYKDITGICIDALISEKLCAFCINPCQICHKLP